MTQHDNEVGLHLKDHLCFATMTKPAVSRMGGVEIKLHAF
jgi:hypothetical protein